MKFDRTGFIVYVLNYNKCIDFYENILELKRMFSNDLLTCFEFGNSYLIIEKDDEVDQNLRNSGRIKSCLRMNVPDVKFLVNNLISKNIDITYEEYEWGAVAKFFDPDGNLCAFKDTEKFELQLNEYKLTYKA